MSGLTGMWWRRLPQQAWICLALLKQALEEGEDSQGETEVTDSEEDSETEDYDSSDNCEEEEEAEQEEYWDENQPGSETKSEEAEAE